MRKAFTIIELLVYLAIFSVVVIAFVTIFVAIVRVEGNQSSQAEVETQGQFLLQQIQYYVEQSDLINLPLDTATTTLTLQMSSSTQNPTILTLANGTVYIQQTTSGIPQALTSNAVTISNLTFTRHTNGTSHDSVSVAFTVSFNTSNPQQAFSQQIQTSVAALNQHGIGYVSQFGSSGTGNGQFTVPFAIAFDSSGNIWVTDNLNNRVEEFNASGTYVSQLGCASGGCSATSTNGQFNNPYGIAVDPSGNIWVTDNLNNRVEEFNASGTYVSQLGCASGGCSATSTNGQFNDPYGIAVDPSGNIWVVDNGNNRVEEFNASGAYVSQLGCASGGCSATSTNGQFHYPFFAAVDPSGNIWVVDEGNNRVEGFNASGAYLSQIGSSGSGNGQFINPYGIAIDPSGNIWVVDEGNNRVEGFNASGAYLSQIGSSGSGNGQFYNPYGIAINASGDIYVADGTNSRIQEFVTR